MILAAKTCVCEAFVFVALALHAPHCCYVIFVVLYVALRDRYSVYHINRVNSRRCLKFGMVEGCNCFYAAKLRRVFAKPR